MMKGLLVTFEGLDSSGKTTHQNIIADKFAKYDPSIITGFSDSLSGRCLKELRRTDWFMRLGHGCALVETMMFCAELVYRTRKEIQPALTAGRLAIKDRYWLTVLAYQSYFLRVENGIHSNDVFDLFRNLIKIDGISVPDITVVLTAEPNDLFIRIQNKDRRELTDQEKSILVGGSRTISSLEMHVHTTCSRITQASALY